MTRSLPDMGEWDAVFDETYLRTYVPFLDEERTREEARGAIALAGVEPGAEVLDCPVGFGRHAHLLAADGYRVTGLDRSEVQLAEAERLRGEAEWPVLVRGDYRHLPFEDATFDAALNLFSSLGYLERDEDVGVLRELRRVLRPGGALVMETMHRDRLARIFLPRTWDWLPDGSLFVQERTTDWVSGEVSTRHIAVGAGGERVERSFVHRLYTATEWVAMLREAGFEAIECFSDWAGSVPPTPDARLIVRARRPLQ
jgi:ubiquinone/menaquinone biosynthesis C-methylase UbiE